MLLCVPCRKARKIQLLVMLYRLVHSSDWNVEDGDGACRRRLKVN